MNDTYTILIVEDTPELAEITQLTLRKHKRIQTHIAYDGTRALQAYRELKPDLIILDLNLPDIIGWKVLDRIREMTEEDPSYTLPNVIVTTALSDAANRVMGKLQDVVQYMVKPFTPSELEQMILATLGLIRE